MHCSHVFTIFSNYLKLRNLVPIFSLLARSHSTSIFGAIIQCIFLGDGFMKKLFGWRKLFSSALRRRRGDFDRWTNHVGMVRPDHQSLLLDPSQVGNWYVARSHSQQKRTKTTQYSKPLTKTHIKIIIYKIEVLCIRNWAVTLNPEIWLFYRLGGDLAIL